MINNRFLFMLGEKELLLEIEKQYINLLNLIDSLDLSYDSEIDLYRRF